ncbi:MAG: M20 family metallopeptidase [Erysipelotrichaceae bacterium]|jgi:succinyl-diaminopimelate desuccinylase|nr:M20 family metallopeptidase [Erysipelotrichaceae bacterium]
MDYQKAVQLYREDMIRDIQEMIGIPSKKGAPEAGAPFGKELRRMLDWMLEKAVNDGYEVKEYDGYAGRLEYGEGSEIIGVACHLDVVPEQKEGWKYPPFSGTVENNVIYGRGANDNKGPTMAVYYALRLLRDHGYRPKRKLHMIFGCDEEGNMECMDHYRMHSDVLPSFGIVPDCTFPMNYGEHGLYALQLHIPLPDGIMRMQGGEHPHIACGHIEACVSHQEGKEELFSFFLKTMGLSGSLKSGLDGDVITIHGTEAHASRPYNANNAACALFNFLGNAYEIEACRKLCGYLSDWQGKALGIACRNMKYGELSICVTQVNVQSQEIVITLDIRYPYHLDKGSLLHKLETLFEREFARSRLTISEDREGTYCDPDSDVIRKLEEIYRKHSQDEMTPMKVSPGDTYARKFDHFVAYGPTTQKHLAMKHIGQAHQCNEGMDIDTLLQGCAIYAEALAYLLGGSFEK